MVWLCDGRRCLKRWYHTTEKRRPTFVSYDLSYDKNCRPTYQKNTPNKCRTNAALWLVNRINKCEQWLDTDRRRGLFPDRFFDEQNLLLSLWYWYVHCALGHRDYCRGCDIDDNEAMQLDTEIRYVIAIIISVRMSDQGWPMHLPHQYWCSSCDRNKQNQFTEIAQNISKVFVHNA